MKLGPVLFRTNTTQKRFPHGATQTSSNYNGNGNSKAKQWSLTSKYHKGRKTTFTTDLTFCHTEHNWRDHGNIFKHPDLTKLHVSTNWLTNHWGPSCNYSRFQMICLDWGRLRNNGPEPLVSVYLQQWQPYHGAGTAAWGTEFLKHEQNWKKCMKYTEIQYLDIVTKYQACNSSAPKQISITLYFPIDLVEQIKACNVLGPYSARFPRHPLPQQANKTQQSFYFMKGRNLRICGRVACLKHEILCELW